MNNKIISFIVVVILIAGGIYFFTNKKSEELINQQLIVNNNDTETAPEIVPTSTPATTPPSVPVTTSKTYSNLKYAFQFQYTSNWQVETLPQGPDETMQLKPLTEKGTCFTIPDPVNCPIYIAIDPSSNGDMSWFEQNSITKKDILLGGKSGRHFIFPDNREWILLPLEGKLILAVVYKGTSKNTTNDKLFTEIISLFKFVK